MRPDMTLGRTFLLWMLIVTLLTLGLSVGVVTVHEHQSLRQELSDRARSVARAVALDPESAPQALAALPECVAATAVAEADTLLWSFGPSPERARALDPGLLSIHETTRPTGLRTGDPVKVTVLVSPARLRARVLGVASRLVATLALALMASLLVGVILVNRVVEPIHSLSEQVSDFRPEAPGEVRVPASGALEVVELAAAFRDLMSRLVAQRKALVEKERRFRELFLASPTPLFEIDSDLRICGANPAAESFIANAPAPLEELEIGSFVSFDSASGGLRLPTGEDEETVCEAIWPLLDGGRAEVELHCRRVSEHAAASYLVAVHDLTERVRRMAEHWRLTFDEMSDGVALLEAGGRPAVANRAIEPFLDDLIREMTDEDSEGGRREWQTTSKDRVVRCLLTRPEGMRRSILVARDVTDSVRTEERLREAQKMEAVATLAGGVAHDFNNLLAGVLLHVRLLERDPDSRESAAEAIRELAEEGAEVVRGLLQFARPERTPFEAVDLAAIVGDQEAMLRHLMPPTIRLECELQPAPVLASASDLRRLLLNLVLNARGALGEGGGTIRVVVQEDCRWAVLEVIDDGPGIPEALRARIFEPFFSGRRQGRGAGIGLAVVYGIVREHEGEIAVDQAAGGGAHFTVKLPLHESPGVPEPLDGDVSEPEAVVEGGGRHVLVVEDETAIAVRLAEEFTLVGFEVRCANSLASARDICGTWSPQLMVVDLLLPDGRGDELVRELRQVLGLVPVVFNTGNLGADREALSEIPCSVILEKPLSVDRMLDEVGNLLAEQS